MHTGALESKGDVLWFVHADTIPSPLAVEAIRKSLETKSTVGGNFSVLFDGPSRAGQLARRAARLSNPALAGPTIVGIGMSSIGSRFHRAPVTVRVAMRARP